MPRQQGRVDTIFKALGDPTRRAVVEQLTRGPAAVGELAGPHDMALPSFLQHLKLLEESGLVTSRKKGRVRTYKLQPRKLKVAEDWMGKQRALWEQRFDQLDDVLVELNNDEEG